MQLKNPILGLCQQSTFMLSAAKVDQCPDDEGFEVAFAGRSNAGKSSALNTLTHASLARTSKTPGRTQLLNFFKLDDDRRLVDLPGYGYAKVPIPLKLHWQRHLEAYLGGRESLKGLILMMDIRHPMTDFDLLMLDWAVASGMPMHVLLTKADKLNRKEQAESLRGAQAVLADLATDEADIGVALFSSMNKTGIDMENERLKASWDCFPAEHLAIYLSLGEQDQRINAHSILTRALLADTLWPGKFDALIDEELRLYVDGYILSITYEEP